ARPTPSGGTGQLRGVGAWRRGENQNTNQTHQPYLVPEPHYEYGGGYYWYKPRDKCCKHFLKFLALEIKNEMDKLRGEINWSEEIREFIKSKIEEHKKRKVLQEAIAYIQSLPEAPKGTAQMLVREDRDGH
ncbi:MAG: type II toxin-antitoxin system VapB family antitoxin, partial [Candidatus Freyarchaeota archaeon]